MSDDNGSDSASKMYGAFGMQAPGTPTPKPEATPLIGKATAAKTLQSATFGFGADAVGAVAGKQAGQAVRQLAQKYDQSHPLAAFGIDLAVAGAESAIPFAGETAGARAAMSGGRLLASRAARSAAAGAVTGAGSDGSVSERAGKAVEGATLGAVASLGLGAAGMALKPLLEKVGGLSAAKAASEQIKRALKAGGQTIADLNNFLAANPNARIADFSEKVASLVGKVGGTSDATAAKLTRNLNEDVSGQATRLQTQSTPLQNVKQQMIANLKTLETKRADTYSKAYAEIVPITPELQKALDHPDIKPIVDKTLAEYRKLRMNPVSNVAAAPKYKVGSEFPSAVIDDLQKDLGAAAKDKDVAGRMAAGVLQHAQSLLKDSQSDLSKQAQALAAKIGGAETETGIKGAQDWGSKYAFGLGDADVTKFHAMSPLEKQYARLGMVDGMERYLNEKTRMPEGSLRKIADTMNDPQIRGVIGDKEANQIKKKFADEAARMQTNAAMARGGSRQAAFHEENVERITSHGLNVAVPGSGHVIGTALRYLKATGMPEARAKSIIDIATKPGGMQRLQKAGIDKKTLDILSGLAKQKGSIAGRTAENVQQQSQN